MLVNCWHSNEHESAAMWSLYARANEGVAIRSTVGRLKTSLARSSEQVILANVRYLDYENDDIVSENGLAPYAFKRKSFEHEREVRALIWAPETLVTGAPLGACPAAQGRYLNIDLADLILAIHLAPGSPEWMRDTVEATARRFGIDAQVIQSSLDRGPELW